MDPRQTVIRVVQSPYEVKYDVSTSNPTLATEYTEKDRRGKAWQVPPHPGPKKCPTPSQTRRRPACDLTYIDLADFKM